MIKYLTSITWFLFAILHNLSALDQPESRSPLSYGIDMSCLRNIPLELAEGASEILLELKGKLILRNVSEDDCNPNDELSLWFLEMDARSFQLAAQTPVWGYGLSLSEIMEKNNWFEVQLGRDSAYEDFCCKHVNQEVTVQGFLFHAHTGHHHAPFLMDFKKIW